MYNFLYAYVYMYIYIHIINHKYINICIYTRTSYRIRVITHIPSEHVFFFGSTPPAGSRRRNIGVVISITVFQGGTP